MKPATADQSNKRHVHALLASMIFMFTAAGYALAQTNHRVSSGDTLDSISKEYGVSALAIANYNNLANPDLIVPGDELKIPPRPGDTIEYKVKPGDTLGDIASIHGTTIQAITETNSLANPNSLKIGQIIRVPAKTIPGPEEKYPLPTTLKKTLDRISVNPNRWRYIVIHHSATDSGTIKGMDEYHRKKRRMENGLAYHFVIGNGRGIPNGKIEIGNRWKRQIRGGHLANEAQNQIAIGICLVGNFEKAPPTEAQMKSLYALTKYLQKRCRVSKDNVETHTGINKKPTKCPGRKFPTRTFLNNL